MSSLVFVWLIPMTNNHSSYTRDGAYAFSRAGNGSSNCLLQTMAYEICQCRMLLELLRTVLSSAMARSPFRRGDTNKMMHGDGKPRFSMENVLLSPN